MAKAMSSSKGVVSLLGLFALSQLACSWSVDKVKVAQGRPLMGGVKPVLLQQRSINVQQQADPASYGNWLEEQIELQRRAGEELQAAEIAAAAQEEYERIKYDIEHAEHNVYDKVDAKRNSVSGLEERVRNQADERSRRDDKMGVPDNFCDNGKTHLQLDWDPEDPASYLNYTCDGETLKPAQKTFAGKCVASEKPTHKCMDKVVEKQMEPPVMGNHRRLWAKYGKYTFVPWQRWLHNLEHGAVGLLYHKCADPEEVAKFENVITNCLYKHVITPYDLPEDKPFALVSWGCHLYMTHFDMDAVVKFTKEHALHGRENKRVQDGQYNKMLEKHAEVVSTKNDSDICPDGKMAEIKANLTKQNERESELSKKRSSNLKNDDVLLVDILVPEGKKEAANKIVDREIREKELMHPENEEARNKERRADVAHLEEDLDLVKKLFRQKVKPRM